MTRKISKREFMKWMVLAGASTIIPFNMANLKKNKPLEEIAKEINKNLPKENKWYTKSFNDNSNHYTILMPDHHTISRGNQYNEFSSIFNNIKKYLSSFGLEGVEENSSNPIKSIYEMNKPWLRENFTEQQVKQKMGKLWNTILDSKIPILGLEKKELYQSHLGVVKLNELFYRVLKEGKLKEWMNKYSEGLTQFNKKMPINEIKNSQGELISNMPQFKEEYSKLDLSKLNEVYLSKLNEFNKTLIDARSDYAVKILSKQDKNTGILYGAAHIERIKKGLKRNDLSYLSIENKGLNNIIKLLKETEEILK